MFRLKVHASGDKTIVAVCDSDILGHIFEEKERILDVDKDFFSGKNMLLKDIEKIAETIHASNTSNIIGNRIVAELVKNGAIKTQSVKEICGVKYAMVFRV